MIDAFHLGGWGMYPTTIVGLVLVFAAARYASQPDPHRRNIVRSLGALTLLVSTLGFVTGVIKTCISVEQVREPGTHVAVGVGESLTNLGLGLVLLVLAGIATTVGAFRSGRSPRGADSELTDPHGL